MQPLRKVVMKLRSNAVAWNPMEAFNFTVANEDYNLYTWDMRYLKEPKNIHFDHTSAGGWPCLTLFMLRICHVLATYLDLAVY